jgi:hypothetical protein
MARSIKPAAAAVALLGIFLTTPALADEATQAFQFNVQRAIKTLDDMNALFARMDQRKRDQAAGTAATGAATAPQLAPDGAPQPPEPAK